MPALKGPALQTTVFWLSVSISLQGKMQEHKRGEKKHRFIVHISMTWLKPAEPAIGEIRPFRGLEFMPRWKYM